jgi:hypothetical protein
MRLRAKELGEVVRAHQSDDPAISKGFVAELAFILDHFFFPLAFFMASSYCSSTFRIR